MYAPRLILACLIVMFATETGYASTPAERLAFYRQVFASLSLRDIPPEATVSQIIAYLRNKGNHEDDETGAATLCDENLVTCQSLAARGDGGHVTLEVVSALNAGILDRAPVAEVTRVLIQAHNHPSVRWVQHLAEGNEFQLPVISLPHVGRLLTGPSSDYDCDDLYRENTERHRGVRSISLIVDQGGSWICTARITRFEYDSRRRKRLLDARVRLIQASQRHTGKKLERAISRFKAEIVQVYPGLKIQYLAPESTDADIAFAIHELLR